MIDQRSICRRAPRRCAPGQLPVRIEHPIYIWNWRTLLFLPAMVRRPFVGENLATCRAFLCLFTFFSNGGLDFGATTTKRGKQPCVDLTKRLSTMGKDKTFLVLQFTSPYRTPHLWENGQDLSPPRSPASWRRREKLVACWRILCFFSNAD
jgi:hypothetical protein